MTTSTTPPQPTGLAPVPAAGQVARQDFAGQELAVSAETASSSAVAQAQATVQARYIMALRRPRDWDDMRVKIMREVERPGFAEVAWYRKPIGAGVEGLSIRFAEAAMRCMGNLLPETPVIYDDPSRRILRVTLTELESNLTWTKDVVVEKTVERRQLRRGQLALQVRTNSAGETTYLVEATEDEMSAKEGAIVSKTMRTLALRILPGDIQDKAKQRILEIRRGDAAKDPEAARRKIVDAFAALNVMPSDLKRYLGHDVAQASPAELTDLRDLYSAIQSSETSWADALAEKTGAVETNGEAAGPKPGLAGVTERLQQQKPGAPAAPPKDCPHEKVPTSIPPGKTVVCVDCGTEFAGEREPGSDDEDPADPKKEIQALAGKAGDTTKPRQGRLSEK